MAIIQYISGPGQIDTTVKGPKGTQGWAPQFRQVPDSTRVVMELYDWTGGELPKPPTGYLGPTGVVASIADAVNIRGGTGANIEFQKSATHLQWRVVGTLTWADLVSLAELKGTKGDTGLSAYDVAVQNGFLGTSADWIALINAGVITPELIDNRITTLMGDPDHDFQADFLITLNT